MGEEYDENQFVLDFAFGIASAGANTGRFLPGEAESMLNIASSSLTENPIKNEVKEWLKPSDK